MLAADTRNTQERTTDTQHKAEVVPWAIGILRTTTFRPNGQVDISEKPIFTLYTTRISSKTTEKFKNIAETIARDSDGGGKITFISPKGRLLAGATFAGKNKQPQALENKEETPIIVISKRTNPLQLENIIKDHQAKKIVIREADQLKQAIKLAEKLQIEKIIVPEKLLTKIGDPELKKSPLIQPLAIAPKFATTIETKQAMAIWQDAKLPDFRKTATPLAEKETAAIATANPNNAETKIPLQKAAIEINTEKTTITKAAPVIISLEGYTLPKINQGQEILTTAGIITTTSTPRAEAKTIAATTRNIEKLELPIEERQQELLKKLMTSVTNEITTLKDANLKPSRTLETISSALRNMSTAATNSERIIIPARRSETKGTEIIQPIAIEARTLREEIKPETRSTKTIESDDRKSEKEFDMLKALKEAYTARANGNNLKNKEALNPHTTRIAA